jgi:hypothetical protein
MEQAAKEAMRALELDSMSMEAKEVLTLIRHNLPEGVVVEDLGEIIVTTGPGEIAPTEAAHVRGLRVLDTTWATSMTEIGRRIEEAVRHPCPPAYSRRPPRCSRTWRRKRGPHRSSGGS